ncbi:protein shisa-5-like [Biomphalaria glabrata]|uniref:Protein shisa-5-like n=1 Tax=Biomphalaria glabrata TaxID=6526 RepID=A0A9W3A9C8_BIOGL|nr:protein shisa-5-like [Biomphalaria glabrata]
MAELSYIVLLLYFMIEVVLADYCTKTEWSFLYYGYRQKEFYCPFGCCGSYNYEYCCIGHAGYIVGLVFAGIAGLAFIISLICCCLKKSNSKGRIVEPTVTTTVLTQQHYDQASGFVGPTAPPTYSSVAYSTAYTAPMGSGSVPPPYSYIQTPPYGHQTGYDQQQYSSKPPNPNMEPNTYASPYN